MNRNFPSLLALTKPDVDVWRDPLLLVPLSCHQIFQERYLAIQKMSEKQREVKGMDRESCILWRGFTSAEEIDNLGIRPATHLAMKRAIENFQRYQIFFGLMEEITFNFPFLQKRLFGEIVVSPKFLPPVLWRKSLVIGI